MRTIFGNVTHCVERFANNRLEASHQSTRQRQPKCADSNLLSTPKGFSPSTVPSRISSEWAGTY
jgi:hypothetical protein